MWSWPFVMPQGADTFPVVKPTRLSDHRNVFFQFVQQARFSLSDAATPPNPPGLSCAETAFCTSNCALDSCHTKTTRKAGSPCWPPQSTTATLGSGPSRWTDGNVTLLSVCMKRFCATVQTMKLCSFEHSFSDTTRVWNAAWPPEGTC